MLFGFSGTQGQGKTTVINTLCEKFGYRKVANTTARTVLQELGLTLDEVNRNPSLKKVVQRMVFDRHVKYVEEVSNTSDVVLMERTFADIYAYTLLGLGVFNEYNDWLDDYCTKCKRAQTSFDAVFFLDGRHFIPENDGVRSTNTRFAKIVGDLIYETSMEFAPEGEAHTADFNKFYWVGIPDNTDRVNFIHQIIEGRKSNVEH